MTRENDLGVQFLGAPDHGVEVINLEPQKHAVAIWFVRSVPDWQVVVLDLEAMELKNQHAVGNEPLVLGPAMGAPTPEETLIPAATRFDVGDGDQGLRTDGHLPDCSDATIPPHEVTDGQASHNPKPRAEEAEEDQTRTTHDRSEEGEDK